jgi:hypothetical protein
MSDGNGGLSAYAKVSFAGVKAQSSVFPDCFSAQFSSDCKRTRVTVMMRVSTSLPGQFVLRKCFRYSLMVQRIALTRQGGRLIPLEQTVNGVFPVVKLKKQVYFGTRSRAWQQELREDVCAGDVTGKVA